MAAGYGRERIREAVELTPSPEGRMFEDWEDFGIRIGPFGMSMGGMGRFVRYARTEASHVLRIRIDPDVRKEAIKARLVKPGLLEIEWPRSKGEDIPVE